MSFGVDASENPQTATTTTDVTTTRISDAYNKTFSLVYSPSESNTVTAAGATGFDAKTLMVAGVAALLVVLGIVAARS
jgi:hypothetical protein